MAVQVFGVRHHGPGSARSLLAGLVALEPDVVLVEGPPDANAAIPLAGHPDMRPPVALLVYVPDQPSRAVFYPFASFSPEWVALRHAHERAVPARFIDLPLAVRLAPPEPGPEGEPDEPAGADEVATDPVGQLASAAGEPDAERWWERLVEQRGSHEGVFAAIAEAMAALREHAPPPPPGEARREAHMRQAIRAAQREGFQRIAVVCGAWHVPALERRHAAPADAQALRGLPRVKVAATWVPWTHGRLAAASGYGAGVRSPGWYHHLWTSQGDPVAGWLIRVARLLRDEDLPVSAAQVIDALRLAEALAALRGRSVPGLSEVTEATRAALCGGDDAPVLLVHRRLIVGEALGGLPEDAPVVPLQRDLDAQRRRLRLKLEAGERTLDLDLRTPGHLETSRLLHRLLLLGIDWGRPQPVAAGRKGTFHEPWRLAWRPELSLAVIEAAVWGGTVAEAAEARAGDLAGRAAGLRELATLLERVLLADLPDGLERVLGHLRERSALSTDVGQLMDAIPPLAAAARYGSVRQTDAATIGTLLHGLAARVSVGLVAGCAGLDDEAAAAMAGRVVEVDRALGLLRDEAWRAALRRLLDARDRHPLLTGRVCRLLLDARRLDAGEAARRLRLALSRGAEPAAAAAWFEGFLSGGGMLLVTDDELWRVVDGWLCGLRGDEFRLLLPLLRRTVATFPPAERRAIGERVRTGGQGTVAAAADEDLDPERAALVEPVLDLLLGAGPPGVAGG